jgi:UMF1 family MFS transporter
VYLTSSLFVDPSVVAARDGESGASGPAHAAYEAAVATLSSGLAWGVGLAGAVVALLAPVLGRRTDGSGRRKLWLGINTGAVVVATALMFFVVGEPAYFLLGVALVAIGTIFYEIATVNYNAMLVQVSTPRTVGRVSGIGWGAGYLGGIVLLLIVYFGMVTGNGDGTGGLLHVPTDGGLNIRIIALIAALWTLVFSLPVLFVVPEMTPNPRTRRVGFFESYAVLVRDIGRLWKESRNTVLFLIASALFRDGLVGVFTFGGILAQGTFGFTSGQVIVFAIAANVVAGVSTLLSGRLDDRFGPKAVIVTSLIGLIAAGTAVFFTHDLGATAFWVGGLVLCLFVGPAQSASRTFLARVTPAGREGEVFGLYATTGRAVSFLAPTLFAAFVAVGGAQFWGILAIVLVLAVGLGLLLPVKAVR